ncbi:uncharacterized protein LOC142347947 isoform X2 [Convolutriloba macropyga]|uniref:uncharacterized protein LOC142347947 isoform X2 n=1 Tax=Convolutriloba macropyga TaxID=536237 RepID=UPI003F51E338
MATMAINTDLSCNKLRSGPQNPQVESFEDSLQANYTSSATAEKLADQIIGKINRENNQNSPHSFLLQAAQQRCEEIQSRAYKGNVRLDQLDKIAHTMYQIPNSTPSSARLYNHHPNYHYSPHQMLLTTGVVADPSSPLTSAQYRVSSYSVLKGKPSMGGHYMATEPPLSFIYYKDKAEKYYSTTNGFKFTQRPKSAGSNLTSRGLLKNYYIHENQKDKRDIAVIGNEITADSQAHVHRLLCSESRLFASRPPSPVASVVNSVIKAQQTEPETPAENRLNEYGVKKTSESNVVNSYRDNQGDDNYVQFELKQQLETPRPRKTLEMFIPQVEKDAEEEETHPSVNNKEDKNNQSPVVNGRDNIGDQFHNVGVVQIEDTTDCELLDYQKIDWENADLLPDPESLTLDALLSPLDMGPSLREVTNAYAHNLFRRQTDPATLRENSHPTKGYNRVPSLGVRSFNNVKPGYSSVDRTRQMRPPKPETKRVVSESSAAFVPNGNEKSCGPLNNTESNEKDLSRKTSTSDLRSASSLSIASLTFFDDLNPDNNQDASVADHINSHRSSYSLLNNRTKSASVASANSRKNGVIRKQAKLRGITGIEIVNNPKGTPTEKNYEYERAMISAAAAEPREPAQKKVTTITFGSKDTVLENGYILQTTNRSNEKQNAQSAYNSYARPKTAMGTAMTQPNVDSSTNMPLSLKSESSGIEAQPSHAVKDYTSKSRFPNRPTQQASSNLRSRVKSAPLATSNRTVVKVQYEPDTELGSLVLFSTKDETDRVPNTRYRSRPSSSKATRVNCQNTHNQHSVPQTTQTNTTPNLTPRPVFKPLSSATDRSRAHLVHHNNHIVKPNAAPHRTAFNNNG